MELDQSKIVEIDIPDKDNKRLDEINGEIGSVHKITNMTCTTKAKLLQFHENERPPYWGTWSKKSDVVGPRRPFARDCHYLDYEYDSDDDWEEEEEGESLSDEEKDKEEAHLIDSDDEDNYETKSKRNNASAKPDLEEELEIQKMKIRAEQFEEEYKRQKSMPAKLKPRVFGCFWKNSFANSKRGSLDSFNKDQIVHNQLMK